MPTPTGKTMIRHRGHDRLRQPMDTTTGRRAGHQVRLAGGHCLRATAQGACPYANICEHCPSFRTDTASIAVLSAQHDTAALAEDAEQRGWIDEADRHLKSPRLDTLIEQAG